MRIRISSLTAAMLALGLAPAAHAIGPEPAPRLAQHQRLTVDEKAIVRAGRLWLGPRATVSVAGCHHIKRALSCTLTEAGVPVMSGSTCPPMPWACAAFYDFRARRTGEVVHVWSPSWRKHWTIRLARGLPHFTG